MECALKIMRKAKLLELGEEHHVLSEVEALDRRGRCSIRGLLFDCGSKGAVRRSSAGPEAWVERGRAGRALCSRLWERESRRQRLVRPTAAVSRKEPPTR